MAVGQDLQRQLAFMQRVNPNWNPATSFIGQRLIDALPRSMRGQYTAPGTTGMGAGVSPTPGTLPGATPLPGYTSEAGGIPGTTSPSQSLADLIAGLTGQQGNIANLVGGLTSASTGALRQQYPQEYFNTLGTLFGNVGQRAQGNVSDLLPEIAQGAAEWGVGAGVPGSQAFETKLARDLGMSRYQVQQQALQDLSRLQSQVPVTQPYPVERLAPDINQQIALTQLADMLRAAPLPEAAFQRNLALAQQGLNRGYGGAAGGVGITNQGGPSTNWPSLSAAPSPVNIALGPGARPTVPAPTGPGWGQSWGTGGGYAQTGAVPEPYNWFGTPPPPLNAPEEDWLDWLAEEEPLAA